MAETALRRIGAAALRAMLLDGAELALIDVREERIFSESHLLFARSVPLSRLELRFARLVPRLATRIVLVDAADGLAERAAAILGNAGYSDVSILDGGIAAWAAAGYELFSGVNVPSKAFGEFIEHERGTPNIGRGRARRADALRHRHGGARQPAVRRIFARLDPDRASMSPAPSWCCACTTSRRRRTRWSWSIARDAPAASSARNR